MDNLEKLKSEILLEIIHPVISENVQGERTALLISTMLGTAIFEHISNSGFELVFHDKKEMARTDIEESKYSKKQCKKGNSIEYNEFALEDVNFLMEETGCGKGQCIRALIKFNGDRDKAFKYLDVDVD